MVGQAQTGKLKSIPKKVSVRADDGKKVIWKDAGNNHAYPMIWADLISMDGTEAVVASGVEFHGFNLAEHGNVVATPRSVVATPFYITRDVVENVVKIESTASVTADFDVQLMLGENADARYIESYVK